MKKFVNTLKAAVFYTHTHTGKLLPSIKQIGTICFAFYFIIFPNFTFADNITASSTCTNGVLGTYTGPADIEANFDPNTINTTWYNNGTAMTGDGIPGSCTYNAPLTPPTPEDRPGYVFNGWTLKPPLCLIPSTDVSNNGNANASKRLNSGAVVASGSATAATYGITEPGEWGVSWENGDKVTGVALCSAHSGNHHGYQWGGDSADWTASESELTSATGEPQYCWCKATHYTANNAQQCSLSSPAWVFYGSVTYCARDCAQYCASYFRSSSNYRAAIFTGLVAQ